MMRTFIKRSPYSRKYWEPYKKMKNSFLQDTEKLFDVCSSDD